MNTKLLLNLYVYRNVGENIFEMLISAKYAYKIINFLSGFLPFELNKL